MTTLVKSIEANTIYAWVDFDRLPEMFMLQFRKSGQWYIGGEDECIKICFKISLCIVFLHTWELKRSLATK